MDERDRARYLAYALVAIVGLIAGWILGHASAASSSAESRVHWPEVVVPTR